MLQSSNNKNAYIKVQR